MVVGLIVSNICGGQNSEELCSHNEIRQKLAKTI